MSCRKLHSRNLYESNDFYFAMLNGYMTAHTSIFGSSKSKSKILVYTGFFTLQGEGFNTVLVCSQPGHCFAAQTKQYRIHSIWLHWSFSCTHRILRCIEGNNSFYVSRTVFLFSVPIWKTILCRLLKFNHELVGIKIWKIQVLTAEHFWSVVAK